MAHRPDPSPNSAQIECWNAAAGLTWARFQEYLDRQVAPLGAEALRVLAPVAGECILDIGCGCGATTLELAARVGARGRVVGVDVSRPMLEVARRRARPATAAPVEFRESDAQSDDLGAGLFDAAYSRFGVMFFSDPVAAFRNIRAALRPRGRIAFVCWRALPDNGWMQVPLDAALPLLPPQPAAVPGAPGPFAFAQGDRVRGILADAGYRSVTVERFDAQIGGADLESTLTLALRVGALGTALREHPQYLERVVEPVRAALAAYAAPEGIRLPASVWIVRAENA